MSEPLWRRYFISSPTVGRLYLNATISTTINSQTVNTSISSVLYTTAANQPIDLMDVCSPRIFYNFKRAMETITPENASGMSSPSISISYYLGTSSAGKPSTVVSFFWDLSKLNTAEPSGILNPPGFIRYVRGSALHVSATATSTILSPSSFNASFSPTSFSQFSNLEVSAGLSTVNTDVDFLKINGETLTAIEECEVDGILYFIPNYHFNICQIPIKRLQFTIETDATDETFNSTTNAAISQSFWQFPNAGASVKMISVAYNPSELAPIARVLDSLKFWLYLSSTAEYIPIKLTTAKVQQKKNTLGATPSYYTFEADVTSDHSVWNLS